MSIKCIESPIDGGVSDDEIKVNGKKVNNDGE